MLKMLKIFENLKKNENFGLNKPKTTKSSKTVFFQGIWAFQAENIEMRNFKG